MPVPWGTILKQAPLLIGVAERLLAASRDRQRDAPSPDAETLRRRLRALEEAHHGALEVVKNLAEQVAALEAALARERAGRRTQQAIAVGAAILAAVACAVAFLR